MSGSFRSLKPSRLLASDVSSRGGVTRKGLLSALSAKMVGDAKGGVASELVGGVPMGGQGGPQTKMPARPRSRSRSRQERRKLLSGVEQEYVSSSVDAGSGFDAAEGAVVREQVLAGEVIAMQREADKMLQALARGEQKLDELMAAAKDRPELYALVAERSRGLLDQSAEQLRRFSGRIDQIEQGFVQVERDRKNMLRPSVAPSSAESQGEGRGRTPSLFASGEKRASSLDGAGDSDRRRDGRLSPEARIGGYMDVVGGGKAARGLDSASIQFRRMSSRPAGQAEGQLSRAMQQVEEVESRVIDARSDLREEELERQQQIEQLQERERLQAQQMEQQRRLMAQRAANAMPAPTLKPRNKNKES